MPALTTQGRIFSLQPSLLPAGGAAPFATWGFLLWIRFLIFLAAADWFDSDSIAGIDGYAGNVGLTGSRTQAAAKPAWRSGFPGRKACETARGASRGLTTQTSRAPSVRYAATLRSPAVRLSRQSAKNPNSICLGQNFLKVLDSRYQTLLQWHRGLPVELLPGQRYVGLALNRVVLGKRTANDFRP